MDSKKKKKISLAIISRNDNRENWLRWRRDILSEKRYNFPLYSSVSVIRVSKDSTIGRGNQEFLEFKETKVVRGIVQAPCNLSKRMSTGLARLSVEEKEKKSAQGVLPL